MPINIFRVGNRWIFKHYLDNNTFKELSNFYSRENYRFEFYMETDLEQATETLEKSGYETKLIEDPKPYTVVKDKYSKRENVLKKSVYTESLEEKIIFIMKDKGALEGAIGLGAKPLNETSIDYPM